MNVSYKWLKDLVDINCSIEEYAKKMINAGFEVEGINKLISNIENVVVGKITKIEKHPDADKLQVCMVDIGEKEVQIVTGATNIFIGAVIPVALVNAKLPDGTVIKKGKLRGVESNGMMCGGSELEFDKINIKNAEIDGILILEGDYTLGQDIVSSVGLDDDIIEFSITANRCDCMSMCGIAMESAAVLNTKHNIKLYEKEEISGNENLTVEVIDTENCKRYMAAVIDNVKIEDSPDWMQKRLIASGIRPINNIVDITNYVMNEYGQPMHAFDYDCINDKKIIVRGAKKDEMISTLDEKERKLEEGMLLICDDIKPIGIAGVMGGQNSQITSSTKKIVFESALFDSKSIRRTSKALGLATDSSAKYSKGISIGNPYYALNRAIELVKDLNCGTVIENNIDIISGDISQKQITVDCNKVRELIAIDVNNNDMMNILNRLNISCEINENMLTCTIPYYRLDIEKMADIAEEIARMFGYDSIPSKQLKLGQMGKLNDNQTRIKNLRYLLANKGFNEAITYSFTSETCFDKLNINKGNTLRNVIRLINPLGEEQSVMRTTMADGILTVLSTNKRRNIEDLKIFEFGKVYLPIDGESLPNERLKLAIGMYGNDIDFYDIKGYIECVLEYHGINNYDVIVGGEEFLHPGRKCEFIIGDKVIAQMGEVINSVCDAYEISTKAYYGEIDMETVYDNENLIKKYVSIPKYPAVYRDLAVSVEKNIQVGNMKKLIEQNKYISEVKIFDVYEGKQVEQGKKSVAFSLVFRAKDRTLSDKEINTQFEKIVKALENEFKAALR